MEYSFNKYESLAEISNLNERWHYLHKNSINPSIYNQFDFIIESLKNFTYKNVKPFILSIEYKGELIALFYLQTDVEKRMGTPVKVIEFSALEEIDKPYPVIHKQHETRSWKAFFEYLAANNNWHILSLIEQTSEQINIISKAASSNDHIYRINDDKSGPIIDLTIGWENFWSQHKKMRKKLYKLQKKYTERLTFEIKPGAQLIDQYISIERNSWKNGKLGISKKSNFINFYKNLAARLPEKQFYIGILSLDGHAISGEIAYTQGSTVYFCHGCYDSNFKTYSPGMVSTSLFIQFFMDSNTFSKGDFLCGYAGYLDAWSDNICHTQRVDIYRSSLVTYAFFFLRFIRKLTPAIILRIIRSANALLKQNT